MSGLVQAANHEKPSPCPGPIPTSPEHEARCRACGKCEAIAGLLAAGAAKGWTAATLHHMN